MNSLSPAVITLPWRKDAAEFWFTGLSGKPWSMLLHSGYADEHPYSRFDIIVADPIGWLETYDNITRVTYEGTTYSKEDPLVILEKMLYSTKLYTQYKSDLPFQGGALGLFGYDLSRRFEYIPKKAQKDIFLPDMAVGLYDWALIVDHNKKRVSLLSYIDPHERLAWLITQQTTIKSSLCLTSYWHSNMTFQQYSEKFTQVQKYLYEGDCYQINLAQRFQARYIGDEWQAFCKLNIYNRAPFSAFLRLVNGAIISLSPERFIQLSHNGNIQTRPIKGTLPRLMDQHADYQQKLNLANSSKDRAENLMIVDLMRSDIGKVAKLGSVRVPKLFTVEQFPAVYHLVSTVTATLQSSSNACTLLRAVFPGGSITGAPKIRAMEIIDELEPHRRNAWCGSIGYISLCGAMDTNIAIRTLIAYNGTFYCSAGGGITVDSQVIIEYQETLDKLNCILQILKYNREIIR